MASKFNKNNGLLKDMEIKIKNMLKLQQEQVLEILKFKKESEILKKRLSTSDEFKLGIGAFLEQPLTIKGSLKGFKKSLKELKRKSS